MSVNVMTMDEINEVSGALDAPTWVIDAGSWGTLGGLAGLPFGPVAAPYLAGGAASFSIGWDIGTYLYDNFISNWSWNWFD